MSPASDQAAESPVRPVSPENRGSLDDVFSAAYEELKRLASVIHHDAGHSVTPTALVHEAWLKLARNPVIADTSPLHFRRIAARAMRQVLVEAARRRNAGKRGGSAVLVTFDESVSSPGIMMADDILALEDALVRLAVLNARQATVVENRFFAGLDIPQTASVLGVSEATVQRDWRAARAWLARELRTSS